MDSVYLEEGGGGTPERRPRERLLRFGSFDDVETAEKVLPLTWFLPSRVPTPELAPVEEQRSASPVATPSARGPGLRRPENLLETAAAAEDDVVLSQTHRRGRRWTPEEDAILMELVEVYGKDWKQLAALFPGKSSKQIKERWSNQLDPRIVDIPWSVEEDFELVLLVRLHGRSWCRISKHMTGRTELMLKNRFHSFLRKKLGPEVFEHPELDQVALRGKLDKLTRRASASAGAGAGAGAEDALAASPKARLSLI